MEGREGDLGGRTGDCGGGPYQAVRAGAGAGGSGLRGPGRRSSRAARPERFREARVAIVTFLCLGSPFPDPVPVTLRASVGGADARCRARCRSPPAPRGDLAGWYGEVSNNSSLSFTVHYYALCRPVQAEVLMRTVSAVSANAPAGSPRRGPWHHRPFWDTEDRGGVRPARLATGARRMSGPCQGAVTSGSPRTLRA